ncbi:MAG: hypothetical protein KKF08_18935 [Gammaproteobacteria bacterium]|nr:hypothetical protein [Gammaproteobacteria bacterium]
MTEDKKDKQVKTVYYVSIGGNEFVATYDKVKALELWGLLSENFFRIATLGSSYISKYDMGKMKTDKFYYEGDISDEGGITLKTTAVYLYPSEFAAAKAKDAFDKMQEVGKNKSLETPF